MAIRLAGYSRHKMVSLGNKYYIYLFIMLLNAIMFSSIILTFLQGFKAIFFDFNKFETIRLWKFSKLSKNKIWYTLVTSKISEGSPFKIETN